MPGKKGPSKTKKPKRRTIQIPLTARSLVLWGGVLFLLMGWSFFLGVITGRGILPEGMLSPAKLKSLMKEFTVPGHGKSSGMEIIHEHAKDPKLAFYEKLSSKKEEVVRRKIKRPAPGNRKKRTDLKESSPISILYTVQVASLQNEVKALQMVNRLTERGYDAYYSRVDLNGKIRYRVRCGRMDTAEKARALARTLALQEGLKGFVTRREAP